MVLGSFFGYGEEQVILVCDCSHRTLSASEERLIYLNKITMHY